MKCTKFLSKPSTDIQGLTKCTKLVMDEMYEIGCKISKPSPDHYVVSLRKCSHDLIVCAVGLLRSLKINTQEFALSQL